MKKQSLSYNQAVERIEEIVERMESNIIDIDTLQQELEEAQRLIKFCKEKLYKTDEKVKQLLKADTKD